MKLFVVRIIKALTIKGQSFVIALILRCFIKERIGNSKDSFFFAKKSKKKTILALDSKRYRGDLNVLQSTGEFRILHISQGWYGSIIQAFYHKKNYSIVDIISAKKGSNAYHKHVQSLEFVEKVVKYLLLMVEVDCVTTVNYRYMDDYDWTLSFVKNKVPYVLLYREGMLPKNGRGYFDTIDRTKKFGKFHGQLIIVVNNIMKEAFIESGYCYESQIVVGGALRMDNLINRINNKSLSSQSKRKKFILFYFPYNVSWFGKTSVNDNPDYKYKYAFKVWNKRKLLFKDLHDAILELAYNMPDVDFIIKPKQEMTMGASWKYYKDIVNSSKYNINKMNNYIIDSQADVADLIIDSDVVCAFQSSAVIESAIAEKHIIFPLFYNYHKTDLFKKDFLWSKNQSIFDFAETKCEFIKLVKKRLSDSDTISGDVMKERKKYFEKYFNSVDPNATSIYTASINRTIVNGL